MQCVFFNAVSISLSHSPYLYENRTETKRRHIKSRRVECRLQKMIFGREANGGDLEFFSTGELALAVGFSLPSLLLPAWGRGGWAAKE